MIRVLVLCALILIGCAGPTWTSVPVETTPYDQKFDAWSFEYRDELIERCRKAGHPVVSEFPVRCKGPQGEYIP